MRPSRSIAAVLGTLLLLPGCRSDGDPIGPTEISRPAFLAPAVVSSVTVRADTIPRTVGLALGRGVSDAGAIAVTVIHPETGSASAGVWTEQGISYLPGGSRAEAITASGEVLGHSADDIIIWGAGGSRIVGQGRAFALNDLATVVVGRTSEAARWDGTEVSLLQHPGGGVGGMAPLAVNNAGTAVGVGTITSLDIKAIRWDGTAPSFLPELAPGTAHGALGIDNAGRIVGYSSGTVDGVTGRFPVIWEGGMPRPLTTLAGVPPFGNAQDIHDGGDIVGWLRTGTGEDHAMLWTAGGELIDLGATLPGLKSYASGVNASGVVSGVAFPLEADPDLETPILVRWTVTPATRYTFDGFFAPLANPPSVNLVKAGKAVPVRFSLGGDHGLEVFESGYPEARATSCDSGAVRHQVGEIVNAKSSALTYDSATGQYTYLWKTERSWVGGCMELVLRLDDGQERVVRFQMSR
jgi:probable HAF family extracellular repeat protein